MSELDFSPGGVTPVTKPLANWFEDFFYTTGKKQLLGLRGHHVDLGSELVRLILMHSPCMLCTTRKILLTLYSLLVACDFVFFLGECFAFLYFVCFVFDEFFVFGFDI